MHLVQAKILLPANFLYFLRFIFKGTLTHCKLGYFLRLVVGLYLPRSFFLWPKTRDPLPQIVHCLAMLEIVSDEGALQVLTPS